MRIIRPTKLTWAAAALAAVAVCATTVYLLVHYRDIPDLLVVHFNRAERPNGWQFKTHVRVLTPVFIQAALGLVAACIAGLVLSRTHAHDERSGDVSAALVAAETVALLATIWIVFQAYAAVALVTMWQREHGSLGTGYFVAAVTGVALTVGVAARAHGTFGVPEPRPFVAEHWRLRHLYNNPADPALFVPTREGGRWTLNFGRPVAAVLMAIVLGLGIIVPTLILRLMLR